MPNHARTEQLSQAADRKEDDFPDFYAAASAYARGVLESIQAAAGTTHCKGVQITALKKWAHESGCWIDEVGKLGIFRDRGSENEVYSSFDNTMVFKLNDFRYSDDNLSAFFDRIAAP